MCQHNKSHTWKGKNQELHAEQLKMSRSCDASFFSGADNDSGQKVSNFLLPGIIITSCYSVSWEFQ